jgi:hypothetical protein
VVVAVGSLLMLSPPAAAPIADPIPVPIPAHGAHGPAYIETDPLVGPWPVERFLMPYPAESCVPIMQQSGTTRTPAAVLPAALLRPLRRIVSSAKLAVATLCKLARNGSAVIQLTADLVAHIRMTVSGGDASVHQAPLPTFLWDIATPLAPDAFQDILRHGSDGPLRSGGTMMTLALYNEPSLSSCLLRRRHTSAPTATMPISDTIQRSTAGPPSTR